MKGYCENCKKKVEGVNRKGSWIGTVLLAIIGFFIWLPLGIIFLCFGLVCDLLPWNRNRCPICGLKIKR